MDVQSKISTQYMFGYETGFNLDAIMLLGFSVSHDAIYSADSEPFQFDSVEFRFFVPCSVVFSSL